MWWGVDPHARALLRDGPHDLTVVSAHPLADPKTRTYHRFSELSWDTVDVHIYHGIHFRFADEEGRKQGRYGPSGSPNTSCNPPTKSRRVGPTGS